jgi:hypothetical protein
MYANNNSNNSNAISSPTSWHPIQTTSSYDLWELPHPTRALAFDEEEMLPQEQHQSPQEPSDYENHFIAPLMTSWSFSSQQSHEQQHHSTRQRLGSTSSTNTLHTTQSNGEQPLQKKRALGDATNTAPVLRMSRSRFL